MTKTFVLDTNVVLFDPFSFRKFGQNQVFIPLVVIEELDKFKRDQTEIGRNARLFAREIDRLRSIGNLINGVTLDTGGTLTTGILPPPKELSNTGIDLRHPDNIILANTLSLKQKNEEAILITKDINLRVKSDVLGIDSEDYEPLDIKADELYSGQRILELEAKQINQFSQERFLELDEGEYSGICANEYVIIKDINNPHGSKQLGRYHAQKKGIVPLIKPREGVWGIHAKNIEQQFALDALMNNEIKLVSLVGKAGTGKTLLAIAAGLEAGIAQNYYSRVLVSRPIIPMGRDLGYLPGDVNEKLGPWMQPIFDNIDFLFGNQRSRNQATTWDELINQGLLHIEPLTYIRGRSLPNQYMIVDEAQNLTPHEIKTIITRAGEGTKIVLTGDHEQIDSPYLDAINNGLVYCIDRLKHESLVANVKLVAGERSQLSEIASELL